MSTTPLQIYGLATSTTEALAQIFTPVRARISAIHLEISLPYGISADLACSAELSFQSTSQILTNDANGILATMESGLALQSTGTIQLSRSILINNIDILWEQGQRIYLHAFLSSGSSITMRAMIYTNR